MFLYSSLNSGVSHVLNILSLKSSKAHSEDVAPGSEEAVQSSTWVLPSQLRGGPAVWPGRGGPLWPQWCLQMAHVEGRPAYSEAWVHFTLSTQASKGLCSRWWAPCPQGDSIHRWRALLSQVTRQRDFTPMGRWPLLSTEKEGQKKPEQALERKTSLQRERNRGRKNSSSKYSAEVQDATQRTSHLPHIMHPYTPAVNKCGQVDVKLYHPARVLGKEELRTCPCTGIKGRQLGGPVCCWAWKKLRQQGPLNSQPVTFDQHQRVLLGGIWK